MQKIDTFGHCSCRALPGTKSPGRRRRRRRQLYLGPGNVAVVSGGKIVAGAARLRSGAQLARSGGLDVTVSEIFDPCGLSPRGDRDGDRGA